MTVPTDAPPAATGGPAVSELVVRRRGDGRVEATWTWPEGTTEVFVAWDQHAADERDQRARWA